MSETINLFKHAKDFETYSAGEVIFNEGDPCNVMYVVVEGEVDIKHGSTVFETVGDGGIFGEMALIDGAVRSASVIAKTDCKVVPLGEKQFTFLVEQTPFFALQVMRIMAGRLRQMDQRA